MRTPAVQALCAQMWDLRERGELRPLVAGGLSRALITAAAQDVESVPDYEPTDDHRLHWAFEVLRAVARREKKRPEAIAELEATAEFLLDRQEAVVPSGKVLAAGGDR